jgi:hypothetical protein
MNLANFLLMDSNFIERQRRVNEDKQKLLFEFNT